MSVAIPVRNGAGMLKETLSAVRSQRLDEGRELELVICDSGSSDGSVEIARGFGAEVIEIPAERFSHGATRDLLMERSCGEHVAFLTQDAVPADERWLQRLLDGFAMASDVGLVYGPYRPRPDASPMVARELTRWFSSFSPDGQPRIDRLSAPEREVPVAALLGARGFFTDANGCLARAAWARVRFRDVPYAEDHVLAHDMMRAGLAKVYAPQAAVIHSHEYSPIGWLRRSFDEARALAAVYGHVEPGGVRRNALQVWGLVGADRRWASEHGFDPTLAFLARSASHHVMRTAGALLGSRASRLPPAVVRRLSLEGRI